LVVPTEGSIFLPPPKRQDLDSAARKLLFDSLEDAPTPAVLEAKFATSFPWQRLIRRTLGAEVLHP
jgi:DsbC/DsbD-like thiol-disulfide interchange protein